MSGRSSVVCKEKISAHSSILLNEAYSQSSKQPIIVSGEGAWVYDVEGRKYLDTAMGGGSIILGHAHPKVVSAVQVRVGLGTIFTAPCLEAIQYAEVLNSVMPWHTGFIFSSTGSEATLRAIRLARAHTGRNRIAIFSGGWHGSHDQVLFGEHPESAEEAPILLPISAGIPSEVQKQLLLLPYNHQGAIDLIKAHRDELALILIEPTQGSNPREDIGGFLREIRNVTLECGILFGLDEVITGGRLGIGGGQEYYGVTADLATFGKTLGGGFPIGVLGINEALCRTVKGNSKQGGVFMGGTFSGNPISTLAGKTVMSYLKETALDSYSKLNQWGETIRSELNHYCRANEMPFSVIGAGSIFRVIFSNKQIKSRHDRDKVEVSIEKQNLLYSTLLDEGIHVGKNRVNFLSLGYDDDSINRLIEAYKTGFGRFQLGDSSG